jgi:hypothetical protein
VSAQKPSRPQAPYRAKAAVARFGPVYRWARRLRAVGRYAVRRPHDPDFAAFRQFDDDGLFLDVGASIGQSALSFRIFNRSSPILSLEPLPSHRNDLRFVRLVARRHRFLIAGAAEESRRATLYVPTLGSYELPAESSLNRDDAAAVLERLEAEGANPSRLRLKEIEIDLRRLDELGLDPAWCRRVPGGRLRPGDGELSAVWGPAGGQRLLPARPLTIRAFTPNRGGVRTHGAVTLLALCAHFGAESTGSVATWSDGARVN